MSENFTPEGHGGRNSDASHCLLEQNWTLHVYCLDSAIALKASPIMARHFKTLLATSLLAGLLAAPAAQAAFVYWTDWTSAVGNTITGTIHLGVGNDITVTYTGGYFGLSQGTNYWSPNVYTSATVDNAPSSLNNDIPRLGTGNGATITFSKPVQNLIMSLVSVNGAALQFANNFTVLSYGAGYWGYGNLSNNGTNLLSSNGEGHGTIQFAGSFSSLSFTETGVENWRGLTVGIMAEAPPIPEPGSLPLAGLALAGAAWLGRKTRLPA
jgi:hypothetical protein